MKQVIAMRAIPGSGKSTFAKYIFENTISKNKTSIIVSVDDFFLTNQEYKFDRTKIADANKFCYKNFVQAITNNIDVVIIDNTNLAAWEISPYKTYSEYSDYSFHIYQISVEPQIAFSRRTTCFRRRNLIH
jgi:uridine kinase